MIRPVDQKPTPAAHSDAPLPQALEKESKHTKSADAKVHKEPGGGAEIATLEPAKAIAVSDTLVTAQDSKLQKTDGPRAEQPKTDGLAETAAKLEALKNAMTPESRAKAMAPEITFSLHALPEARPDVQFPPDLAMRVVTLSNAAQAGDIVVEPGVAKLLEETAEAAVLQRDRRADGAHAEKLDQKRSARLAELVKQLNELFKPNGALDQQLQIHARATVAVRQAQLAKKTEGLRQSGAPADAMELLDKQPSDDVQIPSPQLVKLEKAWGSVRADFAGMDVVTVAQIVLMECAREQETDLKDLLAEMKKVGAQKALMRDRINQAKAVQAKVEAEIRAEYNERTALDPRNSLYVDPATVSYDDYAKAREVAMNTAALRNDPENVAAELALTNNLVVYPRPKEDFGPPPTFDGLSGVSGAAAQEAKEKYEAEKLAYEQTIEGYKTSTGFDRAKVEELMAFGAKLGISNTSAFGLYASFLEAQKIKGGRWESMSFGDFLYGEPTVTMTGVIGEGAPADGVVTYDTGKLGLTDGCGPEAVQAKIGPVATAIANDANAKIDAGNIKMLPLGKEAEIVKLLDAEAALKALDAMADDSFTGGRDSIGKKIEEIDAKIRGWADEWGLSNVQRQYIDELRAKAVERFEQAMQKAIEDDKEELKKIAYENTDGDSSRRPQDNINALNLHRGDANHESGMKYSGYTEDVHDQEMLNDDLKPEKRSVARLFVKLGSGSRVGQLLRRGYHELGVTNAQFDQLVQLKHLPLTMLVGTVAWAPHDHIFNSQKWRDTKMFEEGGGIGDFTVKRAFTAPENRFADQYEIFKGNLTGRSGLPSLFGLSGDQTQPHVSANPPAISGRPEGEPTGAPQDPAKTAITFNPIFDVPLAALVNGPPTAEMIEAVFQPLWDRYPSNTQAYETNVRWICTQLAENGSKGRTSFNAAYVTDLKNKLMARFDERQQQQQDLIDKDNGRFKDRPEPDAKLQRLNMASFEVTLEALKNKMDAYGDLTQELQTKLQLALDRRSKMYETLSNILKKSAQTGSAIIENTK